MNAAVDPQSFRCALKRYASGITVVTGMVDGLPVGFTCQAFHSISLSPPLVSLGVMKSSSTWPRIRPVARFCVNVLAAHQRDLSDKFARASADRWAGVSWRETANGSPVIDGTLVGIDCDLYDEHEAGDHWIIVAQVKELIGPPASTSLNPLLYYDGQYHQLSGDLSRPG